MLKTILVHVDNSEQSSVRLALAIRLAHAHRAFLTGVYAQALPQPPAYAGMYMAPPYGLVQYSYAEAAMRETAEQEEMVRKDAEQAQQTFIRRTEQAGVEATWYDMRGGASGALALYAPYADLAVLGQTDPDSTRWGDSPELAADVALSIGRPVLAIPYVGDYPVVGEKVLIAWNGSRQATRAVYDALPLLENAKQAAVLTVGPEPSANLQSPADELCVQLARHGVKAGAEKVHDDDVNVGDVLLSRAADLGCDLLVMGAYGHSRLRELVVGGVTRHVLRHMTVPVLLSH